MKKIIKIIVLIIVGMLFTNYIYAIESIEKENTEIEKGIYKITTVIDENLVVDITGRSKYNGVQAEIWQDKNGANQKFKIEKTTNGNYKIIALHSEKAIAVDGKNVIQQDSKNIKEQEWKILKDKDGYFYFESVYNNMILQTDGNAGSSLKVDNKSGKKGQKFLLKKVSSLNDENIIQNGYYIINTRLDKNKVLDIEGISKENYANIEIWSKNKGSNQIFKIEYNQTGYYIITSVLSNKVLNTLYTGSNGNNVDLNTFNDADEQKWIINKKNNQYYNIISVANGLVLNISNGKIKDGTNINVYENENKASQEFFFEKVNIPLESKKEIDEGFYEISLQNDNNRVIDINGNTTDSKAIAQIWENKHGPNQRFKIKYNKNGYYTLTAVNSNLAIELSGIKLWQWENNNSIIQNWIIKNAGNGYYYIISASNGLYLTLDGENNLRTFEKNEEKIQKFKFNKIANLVGTQSIPNGYYILESSLDSNKVVDVNEASIYAETNIQLWTKKERNNQKFKIEYDGDGYYTITSLRSKKVLDVEWHKKTNGSNVQQYYSNNTDWQKWIIEKTKDGYYNIISKDSGLYLNVDDKKAEDGTNINIYIKNNEKSQKYKFIKTTGVEGIKTISDGYYKIQTSIAKNKVLDIGNFSKCSHSNISLWTSNQGYNQRFKITYRENGFYTIIAAHSGKAMNNNDCNVEQDEFTGSEEQEWAIISNKQGGYNLISAHSGLYVDLTDGKTEDGTNIQLLAKDNTNKQAFLLEKTTVEEGSQTIKNGIYYIESYLNKNQVLDVTGNSKENGTNIELWENKKGNNQIFRVKYQGNGYYKIIAKHSDKAIGVVGAGNSSPVNVNQYDTQNTLKQEWIIKKCDNDYYNIISKCNGLYLEASNSSEQNGTNIEVANKNNKNSQKFRFTEVKDKVEFESGIYGSSGLKIKGDSRGQNLKYYKIGNGPNVFFAIFAVHGWEDLYNNDGKALTQIAEDFKNNLIQIQDEKLANKWTIYIFPSVNPDGEYYGYSHNGPGRTTLYSASPSHKGIDINRTWSTGYKKYTTDRNYNGTEPFQAYEARYLRDFLLSKRATNGQTILVDLHGWLYETMGDYEIGSYYRNQYGINKHIDAYGQGYLINWARANLGCNGKTARSCLVELPEYDSNSNKYIKATLKLLREQ